MKIEKYGTGYRGYSIQAENSEEETLLGLIFCLLDSLYPAPQDRVRPTASLVLLSLIQTIAVYKGVELSAEQESPVRAFVPPKS